VTALGAARAHDASDGASGDAPGASGAPCIYLINSISGRGHLDMYARLYSECLLDQGYRVVLVSEHDPGFSNEIINARPDRAGRFAFFTRDGLREGGFTFNQPPHASPAAQASGSSQPQRGLPRRVLAKLRRIGGKAARRMGALNKRAEAAIRRLRVDRMEAVKDKLNPKRYSPYSAGVNFAHITDEIREAAVRLGWKPDLLVFMYFDMMRQDRESVSALDELGVPFGGILFHPTGSYANGGFHPERYFLCSTARGAIFLNPQPIPAYAARFPNQRFDSFPDVTEHDVTPEPSPLVVEIKRRAGYRSIVLQLGTLSPHKGLFDLIDLIRRADPKQFFFAIVGEPMWESYGDRKEELRGFFADLPENCIAQLGYLDDPRELNSLIDAADILYAVYKGTFKNSSNTITKAAIFRKPILVNDQYLMAARVKKYALGEAVKSGDIDDTLFWLEEVAARPRERFDFEGCARDHSIAALNIALPRLIAEWLPPQVAARKASAS